MRRILSRTIRAAALAAAAFVCAGLALVVVGTRERLGRADIAIVPGNLAFPDGTLSARLESRCRRALEVHRAGLAPVLFVSGAIEESGVDEAATMKRWLVAHGVPADDIVVDSRGATSWHTARNAKRWLDLHHRRSAIIVTQGFHVPRMRLACARFGVAPLFWTHSRFFERRDLYSIAREIPGLAYYATRRAKEQ